MLAGPRLWPNQTEAEPSSGKAAQTPPLPAKRSHQVVFDGKWEIVLSLFSQALKPLKQLNTDSNPAPPHKVLASSRLWWTVKTMASPQSNSFYRTQVRSLHYRLRWYFCVLDHRKKGLESRRPFLIHFLFIKYWVKNACTKSTFHLKNESARFCIKDAHSSVQSRLLDN